MIFHLHTYISYLFRRCLSLRRAPYFLTVAALSVSLTGCASVPLPEGNSAAATSEVAVEQSSVDRYRDLLEQEAPYFGNPGQRRAVWSPKELSPEALRRIGFDLSFDPLTKDERVTSILGNLDLGVLGEQERVSPPAIGLEIWPKRIPEWSEGALAPYPTPDDPELSMSRIVALGDQETDCWMLLDTRFGAIGVLISKSYFSKIPMEQVCEHTAGALKRYLEEFALWLEEHPEFDPPLDAYGPRD